MGVMTAYRCKGQGEMLPLLLWMDKPQLPNAAKLKDLARRMVAGEEFGPVRVIDRGGFFEVMGTEDQYRAAASLMCGHDSVAADITCSAFGPRRWRR
jgi:hypothetical protein